MKQVALRLVAFALWLASFCALADTPTATDLPTDFSGLLTHLALSEDSVGFAVAVVRAGKIDLIKTYGKRDVSRSEAIDENTTFRIASLSKGMTATVVAQLLQEQQLDLNMPVSRFSPDLLLSSPAATRSLTLEHLLSHRTGLPPNAYDNLLEAGIPPPKIRQRYPEVKPICSVGTCYAYQNIAFDAVTPLIERVEGRQLAASFEKRLFAPLNMTRTSVGHDGLMKDDNWARPHRRRPDQPWQSVPVKEAYYNIPAAGGVNASVTDMANWLRAQMGYEPSVISSDTLEVLHTPRVKTRAELRRTKRHMSALEEAYYGLGWRIYRYSKQLVISHFGGVDNGYLAQIAFLPEFDVGIVTLTNSPSKSFFRLLPAFLDEELAR